jgi:hypothetical protein
VSLTISASDSSSGTLTYSAVGLPGGLKINTSTGAITGTVASGGAVPGAYFVVVTAADGTYIASKGFTWTVNPTITLTSPGDQTSQEGTSPSLTITATTTGSGSLRYSAVGLPSGLKINSGTGVISGTLAVGAAGLGSYAVTVTASDGTYSSSTSFNWTVNSPITIKAVPPQVWLQGDALTLQINANSSLSGALTYSADWLPAGLTIDQSTGVISGTISTSKSAAGIFFSVITVRLGNYRADLSVRWTVLAPAFAFTTATDPWYVGFTLTKNLSGLPCVRMG